MTIKPLPNGKWKVEVDHKGIPRIRKSFADKAEAEIFEREYLAQYREQHTQSLDRRTLKELVELWYQYHGINLADGERRKRVLLRMAMDLNNPIASQLTTEQFVLYRYRKTTTDDPPIEYKTFNNQHCYLSALYNKLKKLKVIYYENPIAGVDFIKIQERQLSYLNQQQIETLLNSIAVCQNTSTWFVTQICLRTGARWGEVEQLTRKQIHDGRITYEFTKSKKTRTVPLESVFYQKLIDFCGYKNPNERVFKNCISSFRRAVYRTDIELPKGQMTHILRHSFASHFIMNGGNILPLQKILGHADIGMTMRYAHLSPDHLKDAIKLNPLA